MAAANRLIPSSERSSVRSFGIRTVLLASSTKEVLARVNWYDPKKKVLFLMIGPPIVPPPSFLLRIGAIEAGAIEEEIVGDQLVVLKVMIEAAVQIVRAALRDELEGAAAVAARSRVVEAGLQFDLLERFERRRDVP